MRVDRAVRKVVDDPDSESLTIVLVDGAGDSGVDAVMALAAVAEQGAGEFEARWLADFPGPFDAPPPVVSVAVVVPRVVVSLDKIPTDLALSFDRLIAAWEPLLPATTRVQLPPKVRAPRPDQAVGQLVARCAVTATPRPPGSGTGWAWQLEPEREARVDAAVLSWLTGVGPTPQLFDQVGDRFLPVQPEDLAATWQRSTQYLGSHLVAVSGTQFRQVSMWRNTQHFIFTAGTLSPDVFDPQAAYDQLLDLLHRLEPDLKMALICHSGILEHTRNVHRLTGEFKAQRNVNPFDHERLYEDHGGIVDAQGALLVAEPPEGIDPSWTRQPFGHLTLLTAPNMIRDWLAHGPSPATREHARTALAPLIHGYAKYCIYYPDGKPRDHITRSAGREA